MTVERGPHTGTAKCYARGNKQSGPRSLHQQGPEAYRSTRWRVNLMNASLATSADMAAIAELVKALEDHTQYCTLTDTTCADCRLAKDKRILNRIALAKAERASIAWFIDRHQDVCVYCGCGAEDEDHLVPKPWTGRIARRFVATVPACHDCNIRLGASLEPTISGRAKVISDSLTRRYAKQLRIEDHDDEWYQEFSYKMRISLKAIQAHRSLIRSRILTLETGGAPCDPLCA